MDGECTVEQGRSAPAIFISRASFDLIQARSEIKGWIEGIVIPNFPVSFEVATQAGTYRLAPVYPSPASTTATIGFTLPTGEDARVEVLDLLGRRVATLGDGFRAAGAHTVTLDAAALPSGGYVVRRATPSATLTERITVVN